MYADLQEIARIQKKYMNAMRELATMTLRQIGYSEKLVSGKFVDMTVTKLLLLLVLFWSHGK